MAGTTCHIQLTSLVFSPSPAGNVVVDIDIRNVNDNPSNPSSWVTVQHGVTVPSSGVFSTVVDVYLTVGEGYQLRIKNGCSTYYENVACPATTTSTTTTTTLPPVVHSALVCIGDGAENTCACGNTTTVYYTGTFDAGTKVYTDNTLSTPYNNGIYPNLSYGNSVYSTDSDGTLVYVSQCSCGQYRNDLAQAVDGVGYLDCGGSPVEDTTVQPGQSVCAREGTGNGQFGMLTRIASC